MTGKSFRVLDATIPSERQDWLQLWESWPQREVHAHPAYVSLFSEGVGQPLGAVWESVAGSVLFPFILRDARMPDADTIDDNYTDIVTPYGYGGAYAWGVTNDRSLATDFWQAFTAWSVKQSVVSEFVRLSVFDETLLPYPGSVEVRQDNVVCDLALEPDALWMSFDQKVRKNVKKAQRSGVVIEVDTTASRFDEFLRIYQATMDRRGADGGYYFPREFFEAIHEEMPGQFAYFHAVLEGAIVSTELVLLSKDSAYSFLGGTLDDAFTVRPNDLLKYEVMRWLALSGRRWFVLGGGYEPGDGIFRYKRAFAPGGVRPFAVGMRIIDSNSYRTLVARRLTVNPEPIRSGFFPEYRA
ncbi:GNAT family N-acetyltransferase [Diaminobutyricibacter sp. McL0618]|uniref:GNAT family N-acetyltransferase n=1 Tax=Leifsonia sp. McL0618 TaxID=3415677 RepID=UPI003CFA0888